MFNNPKFKTLNELSYRFDKWYDLGHRSYHTAGHAFRVAESCHSLNDKSEALIIAALYHDAVYLPGMSSNESMSGAALLNDANLLHFCGKEIDFDVIEAAICMIERTTLHDHLSKYETRGGLAILLDSDIKSLSCIHYASFVETQASILDENFLKRDSLDNLKKSAKFLKQFLECREFIYHTDYFRENHEKQARYNISRFCTETGV